MYIYVGSFCDVGRTSHWLMFSFPQLKIILDTQMGSWQNNKVKVSRLWKTKKGWRTVPDEGVKGSMTLKCNVWSGLEFWVKNKRTLVWQLAKSENCLKIRTILISQLVRIVLMLISWIWSLCFESLGEGSMEIIYTIFATFL